MFALVLFLSCVVLVLGSKTQKSEVSVISVDYNTVSNDLARVAKDLGNMRVDIVGFLNAKDGNALQDALQSHGFKTYNIPENHFLLASVSPLQEHPALGYTYATAKNDKILLYGMTASAEDLRLSEEAVSNAAMLLVSGGGRYIFFEPSKIRCRKGSMGDVQKTSHKVAGKECDGMQFDLNAKPPQGIVKFIRHYFWFLLIGVLILFGIVVFIIVH
jgi:hypothetical protein